MDEGKERSGVGGRKGSRGRKEKTWLMNSWMDRWVGEWEVDEWMDACMDGWMDG